MVIGYQQIIMAMESYVSSFQLKLVGASGSSCDSDVPLSRTHTYKKITKPLLERKRRARINKCLDELKDIMTGDFATSIANSDMDLSLTEVITISS